MAKAKFIILSSGDYVKLSSENKNGVEIQRFKKDMLKLGHYKHPFTGQELDITEDRLYRFVGVFSVMRSQGVDVEVPLDHSFSAKDNLGYVVEMMVEPDENGVLTLYGVLEIRGEDNIKIVQANKNVSVYIHPAVTDGKGYDYGEAIVHCSVVQQPVVTQQEDFLPIAASRLSGPEKIPVYKLSSEKGFDMKEFLSKLKALIGAGDDLTEQNALSRVEEFINGVRTQLSAKVQELTAALGEIEKLKANPIAASTLPAQFVEQAAKNVSDRLNNLIACGKIAPAAKDDLLKVLCGEATARNAVSLSVIQGQSNSLAMSVLDALEKNQAVKLGTQTNTQQLERQEPGDNDTKKADPDAGNVMLSGAGIKPAKQ